MDKIDNKIYILGNGSFSQEVFEQIVVANSINNFGGFIVLKDDKAFCIGEEGVDTFKYPNNAQFIIGTDNLDWREEFYLHFSEHYEHTINHWPNVSAPNAYQSISATMGIGNLFLMYSLVNANTDIGSFNLFCAYSSIGVNCSIEQHNVLHPYASISKGVSTGDSNLLCSGEILFDNITNCCTLSSGVVSD
jgi:hypothetical protein